MSEDLLAAHMQAYKLSYQREFRFHPKRRWRADFFISPDLLIEVEGGIWTYGRHNRAAGFIKDLEKYNHAALEGYRVLRFTTEDVKNGIAIDTILEAIHASEGTAGRGTEVPMVHQVQELSSDR